jgi:UDP-N-acetylmuramoylalanine--D-glutamate ligase
MMNLTGKKVLVLGLGDTGLSCARWLARQGAEITVADTRANPPHAVRLAQEARGAQLVCGPFTPDSFAAAELIVISPGLPVADPLVQQAIGRGVEVVGDVELFARALSSLLTPHSSPAKVVAITGANGKSTVTTMVGDMCRKAGLKTVVAGNIGLPVLDALIECEATGLPEVFVLELSSFQLETTSSLHPDAAVVLNLSEDHMDRYAGMAEYAAAKARIFAGEGVQVLNRDDALSLAMARPGRRVATFGLNPPQEGQFGLLENALAEGDRKLMPVATLPVAGLHNAANALAALALCRAIGLDYAPIIQALAEFKGLPHRVEWVDEIGGVTFYDDSKGTNVGATEAALKGMPGKVVLIAGGDGKGQDFSPLRAAAAAHARAVVLIGRDAGLIEAALQGAGVSLVRCATLEQAVEKGFALALPGDAVLLSPACASWDMFRNYAHRAEVFIAAVRELKQGLA